MSPTAAHPRGRRAARWWVLELLTSYDTNSIDHLFVEARTPAPTMTTLPDANGTRRRHRRELQAGELGGCDTPPAPRPLPDPDGCVDVCPHRTTAPARRQCNSRMQVMNRPLAYAANGSVEMSIAYATTGPSRASVSSSTTSRSPTAPAPRSRPASTVGRSPGRLRAPRPTSTTSSEPTHPVPGCTRSPRRTRCCWGSAWRRLDRPNATQLCRALDHLLNSNVNTLVTA